MKRATLILALTVIVGGAWPGAQTPRSLDVQLRAAEHKEDVEGDLKGAIAEYLRLADSPNHAVAASALVRLGGAYQKLGTISPLPVYERVLKRFPEQREAVATARARLGQLTPKLKSERVLESSDRANRVSPDGRYIATTDDIDNIVLYDIGTGTSRALTTDAIPQDPDHRYPLAWAFSHDGKQLVYSWFFEKDDQTIVRIVSTADGSPPRTIFDSGPDDFSPTDWSPDGKLIAGIVRRHGDNVAQIGTLSLVDRRFRSLKTVDWSRVGGVRFSSDSRFLAYHRPQKDLSFERDVFVIAVDGSTETAVAQSPADDTVLEWTSDGRRLLIASDRGGSISIWSTSPFSQQATSPLDLVRSDVGIISSLGPTQDGTLFYNLLPSSANIFVAQFDPAAGQVSSRPTRAIQQFKGANTGSSWSPDGTRLAFVSRREIGSRFVVPILSLKTGAIERELTPALSYGGAGSWSPDGLRFLVRGSELKGRDGILAVDAVSGEVTFLVGADICSGVPYWARDGKSFFCFDLKESGASDTSEIVQVDLATQSVLRKMPSRAQGAGVSPDGRFILIGDSGPRVLSLLDLSTGQTRSLLPPASPRETRIFNFYSVTWVPDGRSVVFYGLLNGDEGLWFVPIDGSVPHKINVDGLGIGPVQGLRFSPKGGQVALVPSNNPNSGPLELWKLENLFAAVKLTGVGK